MTTQAYLEPTHDQGREFFIRGIEGAIVTLNLLRFRQVADYSATPAAGMGHRTAALEDSRLLPVVESRSPLEQ